MRILAAQINPTLGDLEGNTCKVLDALHRASNQRIDVVVFPELVLSGYCPDDLLLDRAFIICVSQKLEAIASHTRGMFVAVGLPRFSEPDAEKPLYNSAAIFIDGKLCGFKNKTLLPTYDVFDERRYFASCEEQPIWEYRGKRIAITICEDAWRHVGYSHYRMNPIAVLKDKRPDLMLNLSGSPYFFGRPKVRIGVFQRAAQELHCPVVFCNQVGANDQLVFDGHSLFIDAKGNLCQIAQGFVEQDLLIDLSAPHDPLPIPEGTIQELYSALVLGVRDYFYKQGFSKALLGLSGGVDSALVACIAKDALGAANVLALAMPSRFSSKGSVDDALHLARNLGIEIQTISIEPMFQAYLDLLQPLFGQFEGETQENLQARIRGMILMAFSNQSGAIVLNTSNKSEMAVGYCTLYGDMVGGLGVLHDVTKLQVYKLAEYAQIPDAILRKVPSAELKEGQSDFDTLPPFEILDPILEDYIEERLAPEEIAKKRAQPLTLVAALIAKIHQAEYKRRQAPIGIRVTQKAFSKGRFFPIVQKWNIR